MAPEALAPAPATVLPAAPGEDEYQTFSAALSASARGRAFLAEYAKRHRGADTEMLLIALGRLEALMRAQQAGVEPARAALHDLLAVIRAARPEIETSALPARAAKLAQLLDLLERRIEALVRPAPPPEPAAAVATGEARLAVVPVPEQPELPIPSPSAAQPALMLAHDRGPPLARPAAPAGASAAVIPDVSWLEAVPPAQSSPVAAAPKAVAQADAAVAPAPVAATTAPPPTDTDEDLWALSTAKIAPPPPDPLAALMLLSEEERIALFT